MSTHCNLESQITWTCESGPLTEELRRHLKVGLENLTLAFLSGPEALWLAGRQGWKVPRAICSHSDSDSAALRGVGGLASKAASGGDSRRATS